MEFDGNIRNDNTLNMINQLFRFPIVMVDGDNEEKKTRTQRIMGKEDEEYDMDMVFGEAEYPYYDFIGMEDRWLPSHTSLTKALDGDFDACVVRFMNVGQLLVPWSRKKFKAAITKFAQEYEASLPPTLEKREGIVLTLTTDQYNEIVEGTKSKE
jgi:hypothetical protein